MFTGYGGGFMERDLNPEYIKRDDSDDEYDEVKPLVIYHFNDLLVTFFHLVWFEKDIEKLSRQFCAYCLCSLVERRRNFVD